MEIPPRNSRRSSRRLSSSGASSSGSKTSSHPAPCKVDANTIETSILRADILQAKGNKSSAFLDIIDFIRLRRSHTPTLCY
mmetsp:Transcript_19434/g.41009  ORF Transcript_19434/g.41009 Transcript_19434/m.41009 type:complete len:81 (+) Transcript_19434:68-310(+)